MKILFIVLGVLVAVLGIIALIAQAVESYNRNGEISKVDCFDKLGNKIDGQTCTSTYNGLNNFMVVSIFVFIGCGFYWLWIWFSNLNYDGYL